MQHIMCLQKADALMEGKNSVRNSWRCLESLEIMYIPSPHPYIESVRVGLKKGSAQKAR